MPKPNLDRFRPVSTGSGAVGVTDSFAVVPGARVENVRQLVVKLAWMSLWMIYLYYPVEDLLGDEHALAGKIAGWAALILFLAAYLGMVAVRSMASPHWRGGLAVAGVMLLLALVTSLTFGVPWLVLFTYTAVCVGAVLPARMGLIGVAGITATAVCVAVVIGTERDTMAAIVLPCFLSGLAMNGLQRLISTMRELREARATVAHLAASEERLRLARDLHDLLGHSLSLITIKAQLAGRLLDSGQAETGRAQVTDIEQVARQALTDVREAIGGFRRPTLAVELAAARSALTAAQIAVEADTAIADPQPDLDGPEAAALAWALREAVTNVVRHGQGATRCAIGLDRTWEGDGSRFAVLEVSDNGRGAGKSFAGNGLSGLEERLALVGGRLDTGPGPRGKGFRLRALVPVRTVADSLPE
ncbi:sensor histidine kinase [Kitasatospora sp. NPDC002040]|uniref:sensor histidine kinase n=1 Tax=Kitasatospora sp. NPDC002040 TaxID=3154661 RepID=UPI003324F1AB